jgi:L-lactate dehydrogenase complex protein LldG
MTARDEMLARVRAALGDAPRPQVDVPRAYRQAGAPGPDDPLERFADRLLDYGAGLRHAAPDGVAAAVAAALAAGVQRRRALGMTGERPRVVVPSGLDQEWLAAVRADVVIDDGLDTAALDACDGVVTAAAVAIAESGTIVLDASADQGRRALTLVPDIHVCVVRGDQIVAGVPEAMRRLDPVRPLTWISGPSATSDIELDRVEGVHGPRVLEVVVVGTS